MDIVNSNSMDKCRMNQIYFEKPEFESNNISSRDNLIHILGLNSCEIFANCLDTSIGFEELKSRDFAIIKELEIPNIDILKFRFKILIQCFRLLSRGLLPNSRLIFQLFNLMDELIVRKSYLFVLKRDKDEDNIYETMKAYFNYSKFIFYEKMKNYGDLFAEKNRINVVDKDHDLIKLVAEINSLRVNTLKYTGSVIAKNDTFSYWEKYVCNQKKFLKALINIDVERRMRNYVSLPADISYKATLHEKLINLSRNQSRVRNRISNLAQFYNVDLKENDTISQGISNKCLLIPSIYNEVYDKKNLILNNISNRIGNFWKSRSPTIQQYRFQIIIENFPIEREKMMKELKRRRLLLSRLAISATKQVVSIQSQKQINMEKKERERLRLLRENDLEAYLELVKETKNRRLQELINQTDRFLIDIGLRVQDQKMSSNNYEDNENLKMNRNVDSFDFVSFSKSSVSSYYTMAHSISEHISDKPMKLLKGGELLPYQITGVEWMLSLYNNKLHGILADEMGLGKTIQTIALLTYLHEHKQNHGPHLIIVPLSTLPNWQKEFQIWSPSLKILCFKGNRYERRCLIQEIRRSQFNICLTTFDFIIRESNALQSIQWKHIIVDEGHRLKNSKSKFHVVLHDFQSFNRILLTGTPLQNNITELWSLLNFLLPEVFHSVEDFQVWFSKPFNDLPSNENDNLELSEEEKLFIINRLHSILRPFLLRRVKSDVLQDLPEKKEFIVRMELTPWQKIVYDQIKQKAVHSMDLSSGKIQYRSVSNTIMQLRKIVNHPYLFVDEYLIENDDIFRVSCKFEILDRIIPKLIFFKHKVLIFCQMTQLMDILGDYLDYRGIEYHRLDGTMTIQERKEKMDEFNSEDSQKYVFVLSTRAGGLGLNLQAADTVIIFDSDWNPHQDLQAQSRAHRMGQKNEVRVIRLISISGVEELVLKRAQKKLEIDHKIIQAGMFNSTQVVEDDREDRLRELFGKEEYKSDARITTPSEINEFISRNDSEFKVFEEMDKKTFGKSIYLKIQEWSNKTISETQIKLEKERNKDLNNENNENNENKNDSLLEFGNKISKSPPKPKKPGRKQKSVNNEEQNELELQKSDEKNEILTLEDSKVYLDLMEKAGRIISIDEVPSWVVRPPNEVNAELGIEDNNYNELKDLPRSQRKSRWKSSKDYLCVEGVSERTFLKIMEQYESGEITDITKALLKETTKKRKSTRRNSSVSNGDTTEKNAYFSSFCDSTPRKATSKRRKTISFFEEEDDDEYREVKYRESKSRNRNSLVDSELRKNSKNNGNIHSIKDKENQSLHSTSSEYIEALPDTPEAIPISN